MRNRPICLSVCDYSGNWAKPWTETHDVLLIDPKHPSGFSDREGGVSTYGGTAQDFKDFLDRNPLVAAVWEKETDVILLAPPCTHFTVSGAQYWGAKDRDGRTADALAIVDACLAIVDRLSPEVWALENPVGRLPELRPNLGRPAVYFNPWEYAGYLPEGEKKKDAYTKKTGLWGQFAVPERKPVEPIRACKQGSWVQKLGGASARTKELRSMTPAGFAVAFYLANRPEGCGI